MPQNQPFEIPQQLRELAERNVEQARTAYGQLMDAMAQATGMWMSANQEIISRPTHRHGPPEPLATTTPEGHRTSFPC